MSAQEKNKTVLYLGLGALALWGLSRGRTDAAFGDYGSGGAGGATDEALPVMDGTRFYDPNDLGAMGWSGEVAPYSGYGGNASPTQQIQPYHSAVFDPRLTFDMIAGRGLVTRSSQGFGAPGIPQNVRVPAEAAFAFGGDAINPDGSFNPSFRYERRVGLRTEAVGIVNAAPANKDANAYLKPAPQYGADARASTPTQPPVPSLGFGSLLHGANPNPPAPVSPRVVLAPPARPAPPSSPMVVAPDPFAGRSAPAARPSVDRKGSRLLERGY